MFPVNLYLSYAFLLKLCILLVYLSFFNCYPKFNLVFSTFKRTYYYHFDMAKLYA